MSTEMLSPHFSLRELTRSHIAMRLGIDNTPDSRALEALYWLAQQVLEPVRSRFGRFSPSSGFRCLELNTAAKGSRSSDHIYGRAADFEVWGVDNLELAHWIRASAIPYDQLILEYYEPGDPNSGWIHCSSKPGDENRGEVLTAIRLTNGNVEYLEGLIA